MPNPPDGELDGKPSSPNQANLECGLEKSRPTPFLGTSFMDSGHIPRVKQGSKDDKSGVPEAERALERISRIFVISVMVGRTTFRSYL